MPKNTKIFPKVGDLVKYWFTGPGEHGTSTVLSVSPYKGKYKEWFLWDIVITSCTKSGKTEICIEDAYQYRQLLEDAKKLMAKGNQ